MTEPIATPVAPKKRGRKTREEEARSFLRELGVDPDEIVPRSAADDPMPTTDAELFDEFKALLWRRRHQLEGTAFTQAVNALAKWAESSKSDDERAGVQPTIADIIGGNVLLPVERKREILAGALAELEVERAAIMEALGELSAAEQSA